MARGNEDRKDEDINKDSYCGYADEHRLASQTANKHPIAAHSRQAAAIVRSFTSTTYTSKQTATLECNFKLQQLAWRIGHSAFMPTAAFDPIQPPPTIPIHPNRTVLYDIRLYHHACPSCRDYPPPADFSGTGFC
jgi:hypothetical protein